MASPDYSLFATLSTPLVADACMRVGASFTAPPAGIRPLTPGMRMAGPALPVTHSGSVDVFLLALEQSRAGDVLTIDNGARTDEGCIGDLIVAETKLAGLAGIACWGAHRDTPQLRTIALPLFSYGSAPPGPRSLRSAPERPIGAALFGDAVVSTGDGVFADDDGVVFVPAAAVARVLEAATRIAEVERVQAERIAAGESLRSQLQFADFISKRATRPAYTFRQHLRAIGGAVEE
jgi:4-hydroxy-4-methyl-2-oxoglutarate aldolase